jgi:hypothetical protein
MKPKYSTLTFNDAFTLVRRSGSFQSISNNAIEVYLLISKLGSKCPEALQDRASMETDIYQWTGLSFIHQK